MLHNHTDPDSCRYCGAHACSQIRWRTRLLLAAILGSYIAGVLSALVVNVLRIPSAWPFPLVLLSIGVPLAAAGFVSGAIVVIGMTLPDLKHSRT